MLKSNKPNEPIEREISLSKKATLVLSQSELIQTFFISIDVCEHRSLKAKQTRFSLHFLML